MSEDVTRDAFLGGRLTLVQPRRGHRAGTDAALLSACVTPPAGGLVVDLGAGVGAAGLSVAVRVPGCAVLLVERDAAVAALARETIAANPGLAPRCAVAQVDVTAPARMREAAGLVPGSAACAIMNPPFHIEGTVRASPESYRRDAHMLGEAAEEPWLRAAAAVLRPGGILAIVHRADALARLLDRLARRFGDVRVKPVQPRREAEAARVLLRARKGSRAPLRLLPPLVLHEADGAFTPQAAALHAGEAAIDWGEG